jgi:SAM-dependent methyltransferase
MEATVPLSANARLRYDAIDRLLAPLSARSFLEIGCGQGALASILARRYDYYGYEPDAASYSVTRRRLEQLGRGRVANLALPSDPNRVFDIVAAFEVLEHLERDDEAVLAWTRWLTPGGHLLISVPAHPDRFGPADEYVGHFRRYSRVGLHDLLERAGLSQVTIEAYGFPLGYGLEWARNWLLSLRMRRSPASMADRTGESGRTLQPAAALAPLLWAGTLPFRYLQRPFASSDLGTGFVARGKLAS